jgi:Holliday junction resolvase RusA-like endonuclease
MQIAEAMIADPPKHRPGRKPHISTSAVLTIPPSTNALWFNAPGRGRVRTDEYRAWLEQAGWHLKEQRVARIPGTVGLELLVGLQKRRCDVDNVIKPFGDLLQAIGIIQNDHDIVEVSAKWDKTVRPGFVRLTLRQVLEPEKRMSAEGRRRVGAKARELQAWYRRQREALAQELHAEQISEQYAHVRARARHGLLQVKANVET